MQDVAQLAGVSTMTVSLALRKGWGYLLMYHN